MFDPEAFWFPIICGKYFLRVTKSLLTKRWPRREQKWGYAMAHRVFLPTLETLVNCSLMFENVPSDYSSLQMHVHPRSSGDTLWASGVEMNERMSTPMQKYLQSLTFIADQQDSFIGAEEKRRIRIMDRTKRSPP